MSDPFTNHFYVDDYDDDDDGYDEPWDDEPDDDWDYEPWDDPDFDPMDNPEPVRYWSFGPMHITICGEEVQWRRLPRFVFGGRWDGWICPVDFGRVGVTVFKLRRWNETRDNRAMPF
jgi:hypothetical protein